MDPSRSSAVWIALLASIAASATSVADASAQQTLTVRYASPSGDMTSPECTDPADPCPLEAAINVAATGDRVQMQPGDYFRSTLIDIQKDIDLRGAPGQPRPRLLSSASTALRHGGVGGSLRYIEVQDSAASGIGIQLRENVSVQELVVTAPSTACMVSAVGATSTTLKNTLCRSTAAVTGWGILFRACSTGSSFTLRNVTAVASGSSSFGVEAGASGSGLCDGANVTATAVNTIAAATHDVKAATNASTTTFTLSYSNWDTSQVDSGGTVVNGGNNQTAQPGFANPGAGDFHEALGSPTIDAGQTDDTLNGPFDFDGGARTLGAATDIGADEFVPVATGDGGVTGAGDVVTPPGAVPDATPPVFVSLSLTRRIFAVDPNGRAERPVAALRAERPVAALRAKRGTTFKYSLSESARVLFTIKRALPGRRVGSKCRKPTLSNRRNERCTRYALLGRFAQQAVGGTNSKKWSGKIGRKSAAPGRYRATITATDAAGNRSQRKRRSFRVVRR